MRRVIAERLLESKNTIPHYYMSTSCNMGRLLKLRADMNKISSLRISVNDMLIKAMGLACKAVPETNSHWYGDYIR